MADGFNPLALLAPDLYAQQLSIQRRQAMAQSLMQQGMGDPGSAAYGGIRNAGNSILGAFLTRSADKDMANMYAPQSDAAPTMASSAPPQPSPQVSNSPDSMDPEGNPMASMAPQGGTSPQIGNTPRPVSAQLANSPAALGQALQGKRTIPSVMGGAIPDLPGMSHQQSMLAYFQSPQAYFTALASANAPTNEQKNANYAFPGDPEGQRGVVGAGLTKSGTINVNRGMAFVPDGHGGFTRVFAPPVAPEGYMMQNGPNGEMQLAPVAGGVQAVAGSSMAKGAGTAAVTPFTGYDAGGMPQATNALAMTGNPAAQGLIQGQPQAPIGIRSNNPGNLQPGGHQATYGTPAEGILRASSNLDSYAKQGINTIGGIISRWAPPQSNDTASYVADVSKRLGVDPNQPLNMQDQRVKGAVLEAIFNHENGPRAMAQAGAQPPQALAPALSNSQGSFLTGLGKDSIDRHDAIVAAASESPMRINVLDNIIKLSESGVQTGPGAEWQNSMKGYLANTPGLGKLLTGTQTGVGNFQELQKFMYQNALRNWQAAGGTGTDSQLESAAKANPNDHLFPQALQTIAKWGKASELAVQGKANAQDAYLSQNGMTPQNQIKFESQWRNNFDPKVFQYSLMSPQEKQVFAQQELKTPQAAKAFIAKQQALKQLGAIQ